MPSAPDRAPAPRPRAGLHPRALTAPAPGWTTSADVIVVGSGIAGLTCALRLREQVDRVLLVTKTVLDEGSTAWAQGGIAAALHPEDSPAEHLEDTLVAGVGLCDREAVEALVTEGPPRVHELVALGAEFDLDAEGEIKLTREGGHHRDRIAHAGGDATGREISRALIAALHRVIDDPGIEVVEHALVVDLLQDDAGDGAPVHGVTLHVIGEGQLDGVGAAYARAVVLATGGLGQIYTSTTNPPVATGDGMAAALRAGARMTDLEFIQFHPTVLFLGEGSTGQQPLISEAVRGEGAVPRGRGRAPDHGGSPPARGPRAARRRGPGDPRDDARAGHRPRLPRRAPPRGRLPRGAVPLDRRELPVAGLRPGDATCSRSRRRSTTRPEGIETDLHGRSSLPGLYACGECSCTGVHGANRLASNSLLEGLVFASRIASDIPARIAAGELPEVAVPCRADAAAGDAAPGALLDSSQRLTVQRAMTLGSGPVRSAECRGGDRARRSPTSPRCRRPPPSPGPSRGRRPTCCTSARRSPSSPAGARRRAAGHVRSDFPDRDDARWLVRQSVVVAPDRSLTVTERTMP